MKFLDTRLLEVTDGEVLKSVHVWSHSASAYCSCLTVAGTPGGRAAVQIACRHNGVVVPVTTPALCVCTEARVSFIISMLILIVRLNHVHLVENWHKSSLLIAMCQLSEHTCTHTHTHRRTHVQFTNIYTQLRHLNVELGRRHIAGYLPQTPPPSCASETAAMQEDFECAGVTMTSLVCRGRVCV